ncbi:MAG: efflux RND transporter permease subunit [Planctomycetota bacterium]
MMRISDVAITRPVFTTMVILGLVVFGLVSYRDIGVDLFPRVEFPVITVISVLPGADPETVETTVTDPIEEAVSTISGIKHLRSVSSDNVSQVIIEFELSKDVDVAFQEVQAKLGTVRSALPEDMEDSVVEKFDIDSSPIMAVIVSGDLETEELTRIAKDRVKDRLQKVENVGQVKLVGGRERQMWLWLTRSKLEGYGLTVQDVSRALKTEHVELPGGRVEMGDLELLVKTKAEFDTQEQFSNMVIAYRNNTAIRVRDIGRVEDGLEEERSRARLNDQGAVALLVRRQSGTNTVAVADDVKAEVELLREELSAYGLELEIAQDQSTFIKHSIDEIQFHLVFGGLLAVMIVFVMLRNWRITLISAFAIPTSVISTFILMNAMGFTMNTMTMLALSLSIGILIDDAIVVVENIFRHTEEGMPPLEAASFGTAEIMMAAIAITLCIVAVFLPVAFMDGLVGRFFYQFGLTVTFAVLISLFVAFTLAPMLSSRYLKAQRHGKLYKLSEKIFGALDKSYARLLRSVLRFRWITVLAAVAILIGTVFLVGKLRSEFLPQEDQSEFNVRVKAPLGSPISLTDSVMKRIQKQLEGRPWLEYTFVSMGSDELQRVNEGTIYVRMKEKDERELSQEEAMAWMRDQIASIHEARVSVEAVPRVSGGGRSSAQLQLEIRGPDLNELAEISDDLMDQLDKAGGYVDVDSNHETGKPEVNVFVKREEAADLGVAPIDIATTVNAAIGGSDVSKFKSGGDRYDVSIRLRGVDRDDPADISLLSVRSNTGRLVQISKVARVERTSGPVQIQRYNRQRQITILANPEGPKSPR